MKKKSITVRVGALTGLGMWLLALPAWAQHPQEEQELSWADSVYTVPPPPGYGLMEEEDEQEVVEAAPFAPWLEEGVGFDTTAAVSIEELDKDYSYVPSVPDEVIIDRLSCMQGQVPMTFTPSVRKFIDFFSVRRRTYTMNILRKKNLFFPMFERIFREEGVPEELKYLAIVESALKPDALSRVGARGLWQFMPATGRAYGLTQNGYLDERMDPLQSTRAAAKYLRALYARFGDWELAIAAYNCGPGNILKAQKRAGAFHFWDIYQKLPAETRSYLPQLVAIAYVMNYADEHNMAHDEPFFPISTQEVYVSQSLDLGKLADEINVCEEDLRGLNPALKAGHVPGYAQNCVVNIPAARADYFMANRDSILARVGYEGKDVQEQEVQYYVVRRGDSLPKVASRYGVTTTQLRSWNNLRSNTVYPGRRLVVYGKSYARPAASGSVAKVTKPVYHTVRRGESLGVIARRYRLSVSQLKSMNRLRKDLVYAGQRLMVSRGKTIYVSKPAPKEEPKEVVKETPAKVDTAATVSAEEVKETPKATPKAASKPAAKPVAKKPVHKPAVRTYTVKSGDTLWSVAQKHGMTVMELRKLNGGQGDKLSLGQKLKVK